MSLVPLLMVAHDLADPTLERLKALDNIKPLPTP